MNWIEVALIIAVLVGIAAGTALVVRSPTFWMAMGTAVVRAMLPAVIAYVTKRMPPEEEADWRRAVRQGRGDEWLRERARKRRN